MSGTPATLESTVEESLLSKLQGLSHLRENAPRRAQWKHLTESRSRHDNSWMPENGLPTMERRKMEVMFDNTVSWINGEGQGVDMIRGTRVSEDTLAYLRGEVEENAVTTSNIAAFTTVAFPLIRRVYPNLISNFLVAIQPIPLPTALLFFLDFKLGTSIAPGARGDRLDLRDIVSSETRMHRLRNYSSGIIKGEAVATGDGTTTVFYLAYFPLKAASLTVYVNGTPAAVTSVDLETGKVTMTAAPAGASAVTADYSLVFEGTGPVPEVELAMTQDTVDVETKRLKARWSIEAAQDAAVYHGLDIDSELLNVMAEQITREIDALIIQDLLDAAASGTGAGNVNWSQTVGSGYSPIEWERTYLNAFIDGSQLIHLKRLRYANWIVGGDDVIVRLTKMAGFNPNVGITPGGGVNGSFDSFNTPVVNGQGPAFLGTVQNRFAIFHDPVHLPAGKALMGFRGQSMLDTGYVYAPYQPLYITPALIDPNDFTPRRGCMTRFARKLVSANFYSTVTITA